MLLSSNCLILYALSLNFCLKYKPMRKVILFSLLIIVASCSPKTKVSKSAYNESLQEFIPSYTSEASEEESLVSVIVDEHEGEPANEVNDYIDEQLDVFSDKSEGLGVVEYTIQVYVGRSRDLAKAAKRKIYSVLPDSQPFIQWSAPLFRVKVGSFYNGLEAKKDLEDLKSQFPSAIVVPERVKYASQN